MKGFGAIAILMLSLLDDALLLGLSQLGLHTAWLQPFVPVIWVVTIVGFAIPFIHKKKISKSSLVN